MKVESKTTLDLQQFVDVAEIDPRYFERPYYVAAGRRCRPEGYLVIREALRPIIRSAWARSPCRAVNIWLPSAVDKGLVMELLALCPGDQARQAYFDDLPTLKLDKEMVTLAGELIARKAQTFTRALSATAMPSP